MIYEKNLKEMPLFQYLTAPHNNTEPSIDAAKSIKKALNSMCSNVLKTVKSHSNGLTCDEIEDILGMKHQTASARLRDLITCQPPYVEFRNDPTTGQPRRRPTKSGRTARIYYATHLGAE